MRPLILDMLFHDDRMFVLEIASVTSRSLTSGESEKREWAVITRRNVPGYPPHRSDTFATRKEAVAYFNRIVVETPRVSSGSNTPDPVPSLEQYSSWLREEHLYDSVINPSGQRPTN